MLIQLSDLVTNYNLNISGVLHVGAHLAEESEAYTQCGIEKVVWVEADRDLIERLKGITDDPIVNAVVSDADGEEVTFHRANNGQSSSILELGTHMSAHPEVHYVGQETRITSRLDTVMDANQLSGMNFLNLDIQGVELKAIIGLGDKLDEFDYIYSEVNREELYVNCCLVDEIDSFLSDFRRVETEWTNFGWGDAFYIRKVA